MHLGLRGLAQGTDKLPHTLPHSPYVTPFHTVREGSVSLNRWGQPLRIEAVSDVSALGSMLHAGHG